MNTVKKYVNVPITYSSEDRLLDTKLFQEIGKAFRSVRKSKRKSGLSDVQKIFAEKKLK